MPRVGNTLEFIKDQYRHCKPILALGASAALLNACRIPGKLPSGEQDPGLVQAAAREVDDALPAFVRALAAHRSFVRETDPPLV
jgi:catalase